ncbi:hypothetical protein C7B65_02010 [Phormidesmis priestleyi ULC007]|uniref:DUF2281 domain-containing protein n=1 Tax=Phormidesmis priestleyi ULC007 TaxID=1920490 RepID=A0A2T1DNY0_9CYAN|nr:hypothetical protein [Phormidesmis priestleyi]PSB22198.1 hypothetical protein C7B65_02010 [Phormidesmis priestleyi ULC007]PZO52541.1 MAG: hypothetical protein DCF14_06175 [Phormidesmis priestleyi]
MTTREATIAKLQQLPEPLLQQVSDFIDVLTETQQQSLAIGNPQDQLTEAWMRWFESVDRLEVTPIESVSDYQQLLLTKYRQQGLEL